MKRRAHGLQEITLAAQAHELPPSSATRLTVGANIAPVDPAVIRTGRLRTEMPAGIDSAPPASGEDHTGWWRARCQRLRAHLLLTQLAIRLASETRKWFRFSLDPGRLRCR